MFRRGLTETLVMVMMMMLIMYDDGAYADDVCCTMM